MQTEATGPEPAPEGAILTEAQIRRLKIAIAIMTALLVIGVVTLIARVIYLASQRGDQAPNGAHRTIAVPMQPFLADQRLPLPPGAAVKATHLSGHHLTAHYMGPAGDGVLVLDLVTGRIASHVRFDTPR